MPYPTYLDEIMAARLPLAVAGWVEDYHHPHNWVFGYMHSAGTYARFQGLPQEQYDRYDAKIAQCLAAPLEEAEACYSELQAMAIEDVIGIFLVQATGRHYERLWVNGYYHNPAYATPMWVYRFQEKGY
jgi:peptide/nickel transport system substrate-binding protein